MEERLDYQRRRAEIIVRMFLNTADENYLTARWAIINRRSLSFLWNAHQALEKALKALLLFNNISTKNFNHNLCAMIDKFEEFVPFESLDRKIPSPNANVYNRNFFEGLTYREFIKFVNIHAKTSNKYNYDGYYVTGVFLPPFDEVYKEIRIQLRKTNFLGEKKISKPFWYFEQNENYPVVYKCGWSFIVSSQNKPELEKIYENYLARYENEEIDLFRRGNFSFFIEEQQDRTVLNFSHYHGSVGSSFSSSEAENDEVLGLSEQDKRCARIVDQRVHNWARRNIKSVK